MYNHLVNWLNSKIIYYQNILHFAVFYYLITQKALKSKKIYWIDIIYVKFLEIQEFEKHKKFVKVR